MVKKYVQITGDTELRDGMRVTPSSVPKVVSYLEVGEEYCIHSVDEEGVTTAWTDGGIFIILYPPKICSHLSHRGNRGEWLLVVEEED